ncbi:YraN family protein, partial [Paratractidigestivibacter faecalis]
ADIVALDGDEVVLVEVKTRRRPTGGRDEIPELAVDHRKQEGYRALALLYMAFHSEVRHIRFDVIAINLVVGGGSRIRHLVGAFVWDE